MANNIDLKEALDRLEKGESELVKVGGCYYDRKELVQQLREALRQISINRALDSGYKLGVLESMAILSIIKAVE